MVLAVALLAATSLAGIALLGVSGWLLSRAAEHLEASALTVAAVAVRALGIARGVLRYGERLVGHDAVLRDVAARRAALYAQLRADDRTTTGAAVSGLVHDVEGAQDVWLRGVLPLVSAGLVWLVVVPCLALLLPGAALVLAAGLGGAVIAVPALAWRLARAEEERSLARELHLAAVADLVHGAADLVALHGVQRASATAAQAADELARLDRRAARRTALLSAAVPLLQAATVVTMLVLAASAVRQGSLARVDAAVVVLAGWCAFDPASSSHEAAAAVRRGRAALLRWRPQAPSTAPTARASAGFVITAHNVGLHYASRRRPAVTGVDLVLRPGTTLGVVGGSGAGKSSLLALLSGSAAPTTGRVTVGGQELYALDEQERAAAVVLAEQSAHVFDATVRDNLRLADPAVSDARIREVLDVVGLGGWLDEQPDGLDVRLGHRGVRLSGGQRRRLTVARALLSPAPVLLLDEPTEGLAPDEADELLANVLARSRQRAVVVVTHRPAAWAALDELLVVENGRVTERGTPAQLAAGSGLVAEATALVEGGMRQLSGLVSTAAVS